MEQTLITFLHYLLKVLLATLTQVFVLLGPLIILAVVMHFIADGLRNSGSRLFGNKGFVYGFKWLGTPVHEFGHAFFAFVFGHRITEIKWFDPQAADGSYGYVNHSHQPGNIYQEVGKFFIGIGPILMCSMLLYLLTYLLFSFNIQDINHTRITADSLTNLEGFKTMLVGIFSGMADFVKLVFNVEMSGFWKIPLFLYLLFSIGSSITLSPPDIKGALDGFLYFVVILLGINLLTLWIGDFVLWSFTKANAFFSGFYFIMTASILINLTFLLVIQAILGVKDRREKGLYIK